MDGHQTTMITEGPVARMQTDVFYVTLWVTLVIFAIVGSVLAYAIIKFRAKSEADEHAEPPPQGHGNPLVELGLIAASVLALVVIAVPTLRGIWYQYDVPADRQAEMLEINATGKQWWFRFEYPTELIEGVGPLVTGNELVIPVGRPVRVNLRTSDVIHSFWVPKLAGKVDMMPNRGNHLWLEAEQAGYYWGQCAEYCGESHAVMRFRVIALEEQEYNAWLEAQKQPARTVTAAAGVAPGAPTFQFASFRRNEYGFSPAWDAGAATAPLDLWRAQQQPDANEDAALVERGRDLFGRDLMNQRLCFSCHAVRGHDFFGVTGPDLTHLGSRTTIAAGLLENTPDQLARWIMNPGEVKPGNIMAVTYEAANIEISEDDARALVAYLRSLK
jgi:cytochrome c oxidase subunit 2